MPPKELVDEIKKAYNEYKKEKEKEVDYLTFYNGFVACNRNRQQENNKLLDVINNQDVKIADLEKENAKLKKNYEDSLVACDVLMQKIDTLSQPSPIETMQDVLITTQKVANEKTKQQLTKATEIIKTLADDLSVYSGNYQKELLDAEQFLKEIEK